MTDCSYCEREIIGTWVETELVRFGIFEWIEGRETTTKEFWDACLDCTHELEELTDDMTTVDNFVPPDYDEDFDLESVSGCSLCNQSLNNQYGHFSIIADPTEEGENFLFCRKCYEVVKTFLDSVPDLKPAGDKYAAPADIGWRGHYYVIAETEKTRVDRRYLRAIRALENIKHGNVAIYKHMFESIMKQISREAGRDGQAWVEISLGDGGVPISEPIEIYSSKPPSDKPRYKLQGPQRWRTGPTVIAYVPPVGRHNVSRFATAVKPEFRELEQKARQQKEIVDARVAAIRQDIQKNMPSVWESIEEYNIPNIIEDARTKALQDPRTWFHDE